MSSVFDPSTEHAWHTAYTDGGARGNPGPAGYGVSVLGPDGAIAAELSGYLGLKTNNFAEYSALLAALEWALANGVTHLRVVSDSELMVKQMQGRYKVSSPGLKPLHDEARARAKKLAMFRIEHVLRGKNKRADALANAAMDSGMKGAKPSRPTPAAAAPQQRSLMDVAPKPAHRGMRGMVRNGTIHLLDDELEDGTTVYVMREQDLK
jgi:probable phosphoglycerate mutase